MQQSISPYFRIIIGILILTLSVWMAILLKPHTLPYQYIENQYHNLLIFFASWLIISLLFKKYEIGTRRDLRRVFPAILRINIIIGGVATLIMFGLRALELSRFVLFVSIIIGTILELIVFITYKQITHSKKIDDTLHDFINEQKGAIDELKKKKQTVVAKPPLRHSSHIKSYIIQESSEPVFYLIAQYFNLSLNNYTILSTTTRFNVMKLPENCLCCIANLKRINDIRFINKFFEAINAKIYKEGIFIGCVETKNMRKKRIFNKYPPILNFIYYTLDFLLKRVAPKFNITKRLYFFLTRGNNRVISKAETLGRLYSCGFAVEEIQTIDNLMYFVARKVGKSYKDPNPTYGPLVKLKRIGKGGREFYVFKFRTMHPFSEYLQPYIYKHYQLKEGGKFKNDFRITTLGKIMRKFWIDELPMLINLLKGEMKLVGVRPLSKHYYNLYDEDVKAKRIEVKPGLIPPYYADLPKNLEEIQQSEIKYIEAYLKNPVLTDWRYFWMAFINIVFKRARSA